MTTPFNQIGASCSFNLIPVYARFQWMNNPTVRKTLSKFLGANPRGRKGYDKVIMFCWLMYRQVQGCSYRDLESMSGIDHSTFVKFRQRLIKKLWFPVIFKTLVSWIVKNRERLNLIVDSSFVETYSGKDEIGSEYNGYKEKNGFKLHQMIKFLKTKPKSFLADMGYDGEELVFRVNQKWKNARVGIPVRRTHKEVIGLTSEAITRNRKGKEGGRTLNRSFLNKRSEIERYFSRKKRVFRLGEERTRHLKNFRANCYLTSIMEILEWMSGIRVLFT